MRTLFRLLGAALLLCSSSVWAVKTGDEKYSLEAKGHFYVFVSGAIHIIDPDRMTIVKNLTGPDFPTTWGDNVYSEFGSVHYIFAADRTFSKMWVIDTVNQVVVAKTPIGKTPVHVYAVEAQQQIWSHNDFEGNFDVIHINDICKTQAENLGQAITASHGKLIFEDDLDDIAWKTSTSDQGIFKFNITNMAPTVNGTFYNFTEQAASILNQPTQVCTGTHGISYSSVSKHLYVECSRKGLWEFDTVTEELVAIYPTEFGQPYATPDDEFVVVLNTNNDAVHLFQATANGVASEKQGDFTMVKPNRVAFTSVNATTLDDATFTDWLGWFTSSNNVTGTGLGFADFAEVEQNDYNASSANLVDSGTVSTSTRYLKAGGQYIALTTDLPSKSITVVNATSQTVLGYVQLPSSTSFFRIGWAPLRASTTAKACPSEIPATTPPATTPSPTVPVTKASASLHLPLASFITFSVLLLLLTVFN